jgi:hypothetical protein
LEAPKIRCSNRITNLAPIIETGAESYRPAELWRSARAKLESESECPAAGRWRRKQGHVKHPRNGVRYVSRPHFLVADAQSGHVGMPFD